MRLAQAAAFALVDRGGLNEELEIGVPPPVDRLQRVADLEASWNPKRIKELKLKPVGVLKLINQNPLEALSIARGNRFVVDQQVPRRKDNVGEVAAAIGALERRELISVRNQQIVEQRDPAAGIDAVANRRQLRRARSCAAHLVVDACDLGLQIVIPIRRKEFERLLRALTRQQTFGRRLEGSAAITDQVDLIDNNE